MPGVDRGVLDERVGHDLTRHDADHPGLPALPRNGEVPCGDVTHADGVLHPLGHLRPLDLAGGRATLEHGLGHEALEVREQEQVGLVAGRHRAEVG